MADRCQMDNLKSCTVKLTAVATLMNDGGDLGSKKNPDYEAPYKIRSVDATTYGSYRVRYAGRTYFRGIKFGRNP